MKNTMLIISGVIGIIVFLIWGVHVHKKRKRIRQRNDIFRSANQSSIMQNEQEMALDGDLEKDNILLKIQMYIISLWLLFVLIIPITLNWKGIRAESWKDEFVRICSNNILPIVCLVMATVGMLLYYQLKYRWNGTRDLSVEVEEVESENYEYLTFLTTYIIPLVCINLDEIRYVIVLFVLLFVIGIIFIKSNFYLGNPTLALMNYKLYRIYFKIHGEEKERLVISREKIKKGDFIEAIPFDEKTWFVRRSNGR